MFDDQVEANLRIFCDYYFMVKGSEIQAHLAGIVAIATENKRICNIVIGRRVT